MAIIRLEGIIESLAYYQYEGVLVPEMEEARKEWGGHILDITTKGQPVGREMAPLLYLSMLTDGYCVYPLEKGGQGKENRYLVLDATDIMQLYSPLTNIVSDLRQSRTYLKEESDFCKALDTCAEHAQQWMGLVTDQEPERIWDVQELHDLAADLKESVAVLDRVCGVHDEVHFTEMDAVIRHLEKFAWNNIRK